MGITPEEVRRQFLQFAGQQRYKKFIDAINTICRKTGELLPWQVRRWEAFQETTDSPEFSFEELLDIFRICPVQLSMGYSDLHTPRTQRVRNIFHMPGQL